jgi:hypothetical protein
MPFNVDLFPMINKWQIFKALYSIGKRRLLAGLNYSCSPRIIRKELWVKHSPCTVDDLCCDRSENNDERFNFMSHVLLWCCGVEERSIRTVSLSVSLPLRYSGSTVHKYPTSKRPSLAQTSMDLQGNHTSKSWNGKCAEPMAMADVQNDNKHITKDERTAKLRCFS